MILSLTEERVIVQHILDLDSRGFLPRLADVTAMTNLLLAERQQDLVDNHPANNFVNQQPEVKVKFNRNDDFKKPCAMTLGLLKIGSFKQRIQRPSVVSKMRIPLTLMRLAF